MIIPDESDPGWVRAISGQKSPKYELLATKILLGRLTLICEMNPSPETIERVSLNYENILYGIKILPKALADFKKIFGEMVRK